ncbi:MAG: dTDP-4-dehydrorhamnose reductase [Acidobacteriia bacterium]|nr:dTDP-4-dehydrorhamnose reductase [Terriglobia bacterium]
MRYFVTGSRGQLGSALARVIPAGSFVGTDLPELDIRDAEAVRAAIAAARPDVVIHCAAMTDVDGCALDPNLARAVNAGGTASVAAGAAAARAGLVYVGTNEVFDGALHRPYAETDPPDPVNAYGRTKLEGEVAAARHHDAPWIVRTAWVYGAGGRNFVHRIREIADAKGALRVVADEVSSPTWTDELAGAILRLVERAPRGVYHLAGLGGCSRLELAKAVLEMTGRGGVPVTPISSAEWPRPSRPPLRTVLDVGKAASFGVAMLPWREALSAFLAGERRG